MLLLTENQVMDEQNRVIAETNAHLDLEEEITIVI